MYKRLSMLALSLILLALAAILADAGSLGFRAYLPVAYNRYPLPTPTPTPTATSTPGRPRLVIREIQYQGRDEYIRIDNVGTGAQTMTGWKIHSVVGNQWYTFPAGYVLRAGKSVYVHSGPDAKDNPPTHLFWTNNYIWNNSGDKAILYRGSTPVDSYCYGGGCP